MTKAHKPDAISMALSEPSRRELLERLRFGQKSVSELVQATGLKQPNVSNHLAKMRLQNVVHAERIGRQVYYSLGLPVANMLLRLHEFTTETLLREEAGMRDVSRLPSCPGNGNRHPLEGTISNTSIKQADADECLPLTDWRNLFLQSLLTGQEDRVQSLIHAMLARRISLPVIYTEIFHHAMDRIGELYQKGETDEAHEHLATALIERMMARVVSFYTPVIRLPYRVLLGCVAGNRHSLGLRMLGDALRVQGWTTYFLGADVPTESLLAMTKEVRPDLVVLSCAMQEQEAPMRRAVEQLKSLRKSLPDHRYKIAAGGEHINRNTEIGRALAADLTAPNLTAFLQWTENTFPRIHHKKIKK